MTRTFIFSSLILPSGKNPPVISGHFTACSVAPSACWATLKWLCGSLLSYVLLSEVLVLSLLSQLDNSNKTASKGPFGDLGPEIKGCSRYLPLAQNIRYLQPKTEAHKDES
ncbi:hypothetical protein PoB_002673000 [Plakobranchus ocellatus]|uniref:Uncharacterized protein n=1 Tax=Plakobranchus ocellatus TaxID=259542 RepID=A0AAV3ZZX8_9GAST|nr:hypothetical protein PoB_002673000 [Plakobranchus ocellatus]